MTPRPLALYRRILRAAKTFSAEERDYVRAEAAAGFRAGRGLADAREAAARLRAAEDRLEVALHYGIAYPRAHHHPNMFLNTPRPPPAPLRARGGAA